MSLPSQPRRPLSPWPIGAAILGAFVVLAIVFNNSLAAVQVMVVGALIVGLLLVRTSAKSRSSSVEAMTGRKPESTEKPAPLRSAHLIARGDSLPAVLTIKDAADYLQSDIKTVTAELVAGRLPGNKLGGEWRIRTAALDLWLDGDYGAAAAARAASQ
ncbi:helix-turn-helix domain-containing protein [Paractinoplanes toevensis]|uniref:Helix-turn-helix domain-containing protein n=1 Tax=Paractinoplanes toevensis TaxID=571911 RepID=A0A919W378_9ACTN|nr:helix-turn-helix domain-containing protein [Actinoplanes toevensis]GIM88833.1 hypothetical protein Ato02nite_006260 [Actinoplanes toevensis]